MTALAASAEQTDAMPRAEALVRAGEQWLLADEPGTAIQDFRAAMADGGRVEVDPRAPLCRALFQLGKDDEGAALIETMRSEGRADPRACDVITELLVERGDLAGALDWATTGVELILQGAGQPGDGSYAGLNDLLRLRYRIRNDLRLPEDEYDRMLTTD